MISCQNAGGVRSESEAIEKLLYGYIFVDGRQRDKISITDVR